MTTPLDRTLNAAIAVGLLPADARLPARDARPWPVVLLTALGAWLATAPLLAVVALLLGDWLSRGVGPYLVGALVLTAAVVVLRARGLPLFLEQIAVPALLVGCGSLAFGLFRDLSVTGGAALLVLVALGLALALEHPWLRTLLGAAAAWLFTLALASERLFDLPLWGSPALWLALYGALGVWLAGLWAQQAGLGRDAAMLEAVAAGWLLATLAGLALLAGMTFLVGGSLGPELLGALTAEHAPGAWPLWMPAGSTLGVLVATAWGTHTWPGLRRPWVLAVGAVVAGLAWLMPSLGAAWLALVVTATTRRWRLASAAAVTVAWIVGSFYYSLHWPLATKALVLVVAAALLGALAWLAQRDPATHRDGPTAAARTPSAGAAPWLIALGALATLAVANLGIWQKERLIAQGQRIFVELAPVDPRSLMQGDYMRLNFRIPPAVESEFDQLGPRRPLVVARHDARGVATLLRIEQVGETLAEDELRLELTPKNGRWTLVSDAWFFKEGEAARWQVAHYGEFRVAADGGALLVGMADAQLQAIEP
jgi:uncharacterized membrane-anchored protein